MLPQVLKSMSCKGKLAIVAAQHAYVFWQIMLSHILIKTGDQVIETKQHQNYELRWLQRVFDQC